MKFAINDLKLKQIYIALDSVIEIQIVNLNRKYTTNSNEIKTYLNRRLIMKFAINKLKLKQI